MKKKFEKLCNAISGCCNITKIKTLTTTILDLENSMDEYHNTIKKICDKSIQDTKEYKGIDSILKTKIIQNFEFIKTILTENN